MGGPRLEKKSEHPPPILGAKLNHSEILVQPNFVWSNFGFRAILIFFALNELKFCVGPG